MNLSSPPKMEDDSIINVAFVASDPSWLHAILSVMTPRQQELYSASPLPEIGRSITRKAYMQKLICKEAKEYIKRFDNIMHLKDDEVSAVKARPGCAIDLSQHTDEIYKLILLLEDYIINLKSRIDLFIKYHRVFYKKIFKQPLPANIDAEIRSGGTPALKDLTNLRHDFVHNYSSWLAFTVRRGKYSPSLTLAASLVPDAFHKKYRKPVISLEEIDEICVRVSTYEYKIIEDIKRSIARHANN